MRFATRAALGLCVLLGIGLAGCASQPAEPRAAPQFAHALRADSRLAATEQWVAERHGADQSAFTLLERSDRALQWRLALIDSASHSIDLQYYVWFGDTLGRLMMFRVIQAADRGVRVRILFDDLNTMLHDMTHLELRDELLARIDGHPNIDIRVFNAWQDRSAFGRLLDVAGDFARLNRRMHNKQMIVDNRAAIIGGRNLGDEYFGLNPEFNFHDLDVLGVGPVARQASEVFDRYWNSEWVRPIPKDARGAPSLEDTEVSRAAFSALLRHPSLAAAEVARTDWTLELAALPAELAPGRSQVHTDSPTRDSATRNHVPEAFRALMRAARREVMITNAYIIPDANFMSDLRELSGRGVTVRILTNSLSSHDVPAVNSHYQRWRGPILETGAQLYELRADAAVRAEVIDLAPLQSGFAGLHTKAMVIDRERAFVGSMNLDPRSEILNSEMGVIIDSPALARGLAERMERDMRGENSWRVTLAAGGELRWQSDAGAVDVQPARSLAQRVADQIFRFFPSDFY